MFFWVGESARRFACAPSGYSLHHLRGCATLAASVVPLLSLSLRAFGAKEI